MVSLFQKDILCQKFSVVSRIKIGRKKSNLSSSWADVCTQITMIKSAIHLQTTSDPWMMEQLLQFFTPQKWAWEDKKEQKWGDSYYFSIFQKFTQKVKISLSNVAIPISHFFY